MKKFTIALACAALSLGAAAQVVGQQQQQQATSTNDVSSVATGQASNNGSNVDVQFNSPAETNSTITTNSTTTAIRAGTATERVEYSGSYKLKNTPSVNGGNLTTSNDTCMGSTSGSVNVPGVGVGFGTTWTDEHCKRLKMSRELWNKGMKAASLAMDCMTADAREALKLTGTICPQDMTEEQRARAFPVAANYDAPAVAQAPAAAPVQQQPVAVVTPVAAPQVVAASGTTVTRLPNGDTFVDMRTPR